MTQEDPKPRRSPEEVIAHIESLMAEIEQEITEQMEELMTEYPDGLPADDVELPGEDLE